MVFNVTEAYALNCSNFKADFQQGQRDGASDARESYPKNTKQHGYPASASSGKDGNCYRAAYNAEYDKVIRGFKGAGPASPSSAASTSKARTFTKNLFSPTPGVICDTFGIKYCADGTGISASYTQQYIGPDAARKLAQYMKGADTTSFVLSNKVECRVREGACFKGKGQRSIDPVFTKVLFP